MVERPTDMSWHPPRPEGEPDNSPDATILEFGDTFTARRLARERKLARAVGRAMRVRLRGLSERLENTREMEKNDDDPSPFPPAS